ncbi:bifunctional heptose 7-phosphate kinase/heptose 1-phosphate adenyltransferase [Candidatus Saganbacteria bacterium CG08_land_8_20_14_0_20_45_16]|uniref:Bifunctional protein HldE n=1 Tax=Candidatus Saganbacteria bacterium CG08_land_8_20_14_0_20_45_16 TaxID=2014293 RepID=A0A2H0XUD6_UNCSA|nr:MAG: bifunctional heptose 7-phosphate kinase/heptose 1-phosphate adenyltransferase [Candidatus Saganbacteria bacterium CG08_land_8_20_14_0_20_45_16]
MEILKKIIPKFKGKKVLVFGDLMLDEHIWSRVERISPEAPVPIAEVTKIDHVPGGCGNVAVNIAALGGQPFLIGIIGQDSSGQKLRQALALANVPDSYLIVDQQRPTILKSRIIAASQHVIRVDREDKTALSTELLKKVIKQVKKVLTTVDVVIISDYGKGLINKELCQILIKAARQQKKFVAIDPKGQDYSKYQQASIITPNLLEAGLATGIQINSGPALIKAGQSLLTKVKSDFILITRGREGMSLFSAKKHLEIPAVPREVFDITGAGDTVIACLSLAVAAGAKLDQAIALANLAASIVVSKIGTAPCFKAELAAALEGHEPIIKKIKSRQEIIAIAKNHKITGAQIVFTNGCFDLLHLGHVRYLREAKKLGDILIIGLNSDDSVRGLKGPKRPYIAELERAEILASLECVDYVIIFPESRPDNLIKLIEPDIHVKGGDYQIDDLPEKKLVESLGGKVVVIPPIKGRSTTNIVERILGKK